MPKSHRFIPLSQPSEWQKAVSNFSYSVYHSIEYQSALHMSLGGREPVLYSGRWPMGKIIFPLSIREGLSATGSDTSDAVTPYGFGGMLFDGNLRGWWEDFSEWMKGKGITSGYFVHNPHHDSQAGTLDVPAVEHRTVSILNIDRSIDDIVKGFARCARQRLRKWLKEEVSVLTGVKHRSQILGILDETYPEFLKRENPSPVYRYSSESFERWLDHPNIISFGVDRGPGDQAAALFLCNESTADYFVLSSTIEGRRHTRGLIWNAIQELKRRHIRELHLGTGVRPGDSLEEFKQQFGGERRSLLVTKAVFDQPQFDQLCSQIKGNHSRGEYFPPYLAPGA